MTGSDGMTGKTDEMADEKLRILKVRIKMLREEKNYLL